MFFFDFFLIFFFFSIVVVVVNVDLSQFKVGMETGKSNGVVAVVVVVVFVVGALDVDVLERMIAGSVAEGLDRGEGGREFPGYVGGGGGAGICLVAEIAAIRFAFVILFACFEVQRAGLLSALTWFMWSACHCCLNRKSMRFWRFCLSA